MSIKGGAIPVLISILKTLSDDTISNNTHALGKLSKLILKS